MESEQNLFEKSDPRPGAIAHEVAGLRWLANAQRGARVVRLYGVQQTDSGAQLTEERVLPFHYNIYQAAAFGEALARTHLAGAPWMYCPPQVGVPELGYEGDAYDGPGYIGGAPLQFAPKPVDPVPTGGDQRDRNWARQFALLRIRPYIEPSLRSGALTRQQAQVIERLCARLESGELVSALPSRLRHPAARIHGDLWCGNVIWTPQGVLIDPAAQGGHPLDDLAALALFGQDNLESIFDGYTEICPLDDDFRQRLPLHQMHLLMVHVQLFGGSYSSQAVRHAELYI